MRTSNLARPSNDHSSYSFCHIAESPKYFIRDAVIKKPVKPISNGNPEEILSDFTGCQSRNNLQARLVSGPSDM